MKNTYVLFAIAYVFIAISFIIALIIIVKKHMANKYNNALKLLERDKNLIISASILTELNKVIVQEFIDKIYISNISKKIQKRTIQIKWNVL